MMLKSHSLRISNAKIRTLSLVLLQTTKLLPLLLLISLPLLPHVRDQSIVLERKEFYKINIISSKITLKILFIIKNLFLITLTPKTVLTHFKTKVIYQLTKSKLNKVLSAKSSTTTVKPPRLYNPLHNIKIRKNQINLLLLKLRFRILQENSKTSSSKKCKYSFTERGGEEGSVCFREFV